MDELIGRLLQTAKKPALFEPGEDKFWDDPHISKMMLEAHLDPSHDGASRKFETIEMSVSHLLSSGLLKTGCRLLDLGCGPGLYAERLCKAGIDVVGIDISERSLEYAKNRSEELNLSIEYRNLNFFDMDYISEFDTVMQVYGELCVFSDEKRDSLLGSIRKALKKDGIFIFDVSTRELRRRAGLKNGWYVSSSGFWRPGRHLVLEQGFDYPEESVWLDQYTVVDETGCRVYRNWFHDYTLPVLESILDVSGFKIVYVWNDLTGCSYKEGGDWIAVAARVK